MALWRQTNAITGFLRISLCPADIILPSYLRPHAFIPFSRLFSPQPSTTFRLRFRAPACGARVHQFPYALKRGTKWKGLLPAAGDRGEVRWAASTETLRQALRSLAARRSTPIRCTNCLVRSSFWPDDWLIKWLK